MYIVMKNVWQIVTRCFLLLFSTFLFFLGVHAGEAQAQDVKMEKEAILEENAILDSDDVKPSDVPSLLFTYGESMAIRDAKKMIGLSRAPTEAELMRDLSHGDVKKVKPPPEERDISLGGILYKKPGEWTIWLNGKRVTPDALPSEVMDLKVYNEYIELKWFDDYNNQIYPIKLRPHQRFNIDTRIFLPG